MRGLLRLVKVNIFHLLSKNVLNFLVDEVQSKRSFACSAQLTDEN